MLSGGGGSAVLVLWPRRPRSRRRPLVGLLHAAPQGLAGTLDVLENLVADEGGDGVDALPGTLVHVGGLGYRSEEAWKIREGRGKSYAQLVNSMLWQSDNFRPKLGLGFP